MLKTQKQQGVALVLVLWLLALLTVMAGSYSATMRTETRLTIYQLRSSQAAGLAEAGVWLGIHDLLKPDTDQLWSHDGSVNNVNFGDGTIEIRLLNEAGRVDLNSANVELIQLLLDSTQLPPGESEQLMHAILDWRDQDDLKRPMGAEDNDYIMYDLDYGAKDAWFNSVEELRMVPGITEAIYNDIAPALTVNSHQTAINPLYATRRALMAIPGMTEVMIDDYLASRGTQTGDMALPPGIDSGYFYGGQSNISTISSTGMIEDTRMQVEATILLKPNAIPPLTILSWRTASTTF